MEQVPTSAVSKFNLIRVRLLTSPFPVSFLPVFPLLLRCMIRNRLALPKLYLYQGALFTVLSVLALAITSDLNTTT